MKLKLTTAALLIVFILQSVLLVTVRWHNNGWKKVIEFDGKGYYDNLPAAFIRHDLNRLDSLQEFTRVVDGRVVNKYYTGTAILMAPFFGAGCIWAKEGGYDTGGYSLPFQVSISIGALLYLLLGLWFLKKILEMMGIRDAIAALVLLLTAYSTNLIHYGLMESAMSHVYSFAAVSCFLYLGMIYFVAGRRLHLLMAAAAFALIVLIRPVNGVVIFLLPFMAGSKGRLLAFFRSGHMPLISLLVCMVILSLQLFVWHMQTGHWLLWSYPGEGFNILHPEMLNVLFSYKKGLFLYTPITLLSLFGIIPLYRINRVAAGSVVFTLFLATWAISSWWSWAYAGSFSQRAYVEYLPVFAILLACLLNFAPRIRYFTLICCAFCFLLNTIQYYQYHTEILDPNYMNKGKYWYIFLQTSEKYRRCLGGIEDDRPYSKETPEQIASALQVFTRIDPAMAPFIIPDPAGTDSACFNLGGLDYSPAVLIRGKSALVHTSRIYVEISLSRYEMEANSSSSALIALQETGIPKLSESYFTARMNDYPADSCCTWRTYHYSFDTPPLRSPADTLKFYIWNRDKGKFCYKNLRVDLWSIRQ